MSLVAMASGTVGQSSSRCSTRVALRYRQTRHKTTRRGFERLHPIPVTVLDGKLEATEPVKSEEPAKARSYWRNDRTTDRFIYTLDQPHACVFHVTTKTSLLSNHKRSKIQTAGQTLHIIMSFKCYIFLIFLNSNIMYFSIRVHAIA